MRYFSSKFEIRQIDGSRKPSVKQSPSFNPIVIVWNLWEWVWVRGDNQSPNVAAVKGRTFYPTKLWKKSIALHKKEIVVTALDSKHTNGFCLVAQHTQTLFFS